MVLNPRCRSILVLLLQSTTPLTASQLASQLGFSPRTVHLCLDMMENWLEARGAKLVRRRGLGLCVDAPAGKRDELIAQLEHAPDQAMILSSAERLQLLILSLLTSDEPLIIRQIERLLAVSRATILRDLDQAQDWFRRHDLGLLRRPHYGFKVTGTEYALRSALVEHLVISVGEDILLGCCVWARSTSQLHMRGTHPFWNSVSEYLDKLRLGYCSRLAASAESAMGLHLTDSSHLTLALNLAVLIRRVEEGRTVEISPEQLENLRSRPEFATANTVTKRLERFLHTSLAEAETARVALLLLGSETTRSLEDVVGDEDIARKTAPGVPAIVDEMLVKASLSLHPALRVDRELNRSLTLHLSSTIGRLQLGLPIRNPLLPDVKRMYPHVFRVALESSTLLESHIDTVVPEEEAGYIAMQFIAAMQRLRPTLDRKRRVLVVCHAGIATAWLLVARMQAEFPDVDIVGVASILELHNSIQLDGLDAVISTLPTEIKELPAVVVSPLLDSRDVERIQQALWPEETNAPSGMLTGALDTREASMVDLVTPETIRLRVTAQSWQDVVRAASKPLLDIGAIGPEYVEAIRHALVEYGPYMVTWPGVALLHALPREGVKRLCMSLVTLSEPVPFGHPENDPVDIAVVLGALNDRSHVRALLELQAALETGVADEIRSAPNAKRVVELLAESLSWQNGKAAK